MNKFKYLSLKQNTVELTSKIGFKEWLLGIRDGVELNMSLIEAIFLKYTIGQHDL